jgi:beta-lactamase class A
LFGDVLSPAGGAQLRSWLFANTTGGTRLRAGLPKDWLVGDKTGTGGNNSVNDIAIVLPDRTRRRGILIASFLNGGTAAAGLDAVHASLARAVVAATTGPTGQLAPG